MDPIQELTQVALFVVDAVMIDVAPTLRSSVPNPDGSAQGLTPHEMSRLTVEAALRFLSDANLIAIPPDLDALLAEPMALPSLTDLREQYASWPAAPPEGTDAP